MRCWNIRTCYTHWSDRFTSSINPDDDPNDTVLMTLMIECSTDKPNDLSADHPDEYCSNINHNNPHEYCGDIIRITLMSTSVHRWWTLKLCYRHAIWHLRLQCWYKPLCLVPHDCSAIIFLKMTIFVFYVWRQSQIVVLILYISLTITWLITDSPNDWSSTENPNDCSIDDPND